MIWFKVGSIQKLRLNLPLKSNRTYPAETEPPGVGSLVLSLQPCSAPYTERCRCVGESVVPRCPSPLHMRTTSRRGATAWFDDARGARDGGACVVVGARDGGGARRRRELQPPWPALSCCFRPAAAAAQKPIELVDSGPNLPGWRQRTRG